MKTHLIFFALIFLSLTSCKKDKNITGPGTQPQQLPPVTTEGKNTFGCLVNGEVWLPEVKPYQMFIYPLTSSCENGLFHTAAIKRIKDNLGNYIHAEVIVLDAYINSTGIYTLNSLNNSYARYSNILTGCDYEVDTIQTGVMNILRFDTMNYIISGTFEFAIETSDCGTINITQGRFDLKYAN